MRVLWLSNETPDAHGQGGQRRQYFQIRALSGAGHSVTVASLAGPQSDSSVRDLAQVRRIRPRVGRLPNPAAGLGMLRLAMSPWDRVVVAHTESWPRWGSFVRRLRAPVLVDMHNVLSAWHATEGRHREAEHWRDVERAVAATAQVVTVCSRAELERLAHRTPDCRVLPHGVDAGEWSIPPRRTAPPTVKLFGSWDWSPNQRGLGWFLRHVWPLLDVGIRCEIAGSGADRINLPPGVTAVGRVPDVAAFLSDAHVVAVPVRGGVGAPVKYLEALSSGVPVVATRQAAAFDVGPRTHTSDDPGYWAHLVEGVAASPEPYFADAAEVRRWVLGHLSWEEASRPLLDWVEGG